MDKINNNDDEIKILKQKIKDLEKKNNDLLHNNLNDKKVSFKDLWKKRLTILLKIFIYVPFYFLCFLLIISYYITSSYISIVCIIIIILLTSKKLRNFIYDKTKFELSTYLIVFFIIVLFTISLASFNTKEADKIIQEAKIYNKE